MNRMDYFIELYGALPRAGHGDNAFTRKAFKLMKDLPPEPLILDVGCGPGMQTCELLRLSRGSVVAFDLLPQMIERVKECALSTQYANRLQIVQADMNHLPFKPSRFDVIWSEGAIYFLGFEAGLAQMKEFVKPGGYLAVSEAVWLESDAPVELVEFWKQYPEIDTVERKCEIVSKLGYQPVGHFVLPPSAWSDSYYDPLEQLVSRYGESWKGVPEAESVLAEARSEISMFRKYSGYYSYAFFVMCR